MKLPTLFFDEHPNPMMVYDLETLKILEVNESAEKKYGYSREEFRELTIEDIRPPDDIPLMREALRKIKEQPKELSKGTFRHQTKEGEILYVHISTQEFPMENRKARIAHINDLTEMIKLKNKVEEAYHDQRHHIDNNPLGMVKYDKNFHIIEWSNRAEEKTGYTKDEVLGKSTFEVGIFNEKETAFVKRRMLDIESGKKDKDRFKTGITIKEGSQMDVLMYASALRDHQGELKSVLAFIENITERQDYEHQLKKREEKYHRLFEDANDGIFLMKGATFIDCNSRIADIFDTSKEEIIGKTPIDYSPTRQPDGMLSSEKAKQKIKKVNQGKPQVFEWKHITANNKPIDVEVSLNKLDLGEDSYIQAVVRDLTEHKIIKNELESERQRLKQAQKLARIGWWEYDVINDRTTWSDTLYDMLKVDKEEYGANFKAFYSMIHPKDRPKLDKIMSKAQHTQQPIDYTLRVQRKEGDYIFARCRAQSSFDDDGQLHHMSGVLQDVTGQHRAQQELRRREELFESLFIDSPAPITMIDTEGKVQKVNKSFEQLFGYSEKELKGEELLEYILPEDRQNEIKEIYENIFSDTKSSKYYEGQRLTKNGELKDLLIGALPVAVDGETIAAFGIYTDVTTLRDAQKDIKSSLEEKEVLLAEIHHRVKNNMAIISGLLQLEAMNWDGDTTVNQVLTQSNLRIHSMAKIHEKLYESGSFTTINLENYIEELVANIRDTMGRRDEVAIHIKSNEIDLNINQAIPCALILNELVTNAFKYAFKDCEIGNLQIRLHYDGEMVTLQVKDDGAGLPVDFEKMAEQSLGHRLVSQLVKQLQGEITVNSSPENGTEYIIQFEKFEKSGSSGNYFM